MKIIFTRASRVCIPQITSPSIYRLETSLHDETIDLNIREVVLQPRELNGITRMIAYDQESDTLFIKDDPR